MALLPFRTAPPAQPSAPLSPARVALQELFAKITAQHVRLRELSRPHDEAIAAAQREREAEDALEALAALEQENLRRWSETPSGQLPEPLARDREACVWRLGQAHTAAVMAKRRADYVQADFRSAESKLHQLNRAIPALINTVLAEEVAALAGRVIAVAREQSAVMAALHAIRLHCETSGDGALRTAVAAAMRGGTLEGCAREQQTLRRIAAEAARAWASLPGLLADDPAAAVVEIDARDPAPPPEATAA